MGIKKIARSGALALYREPNYSILKNTRAKARKH
jgi:hypothetical protein